MLLTRVLLQVGLDGSTISSKSLINFSSGGTSNAGHYILTSSKYFQSAAVVGGRNSNIPPAKQYLIVVGNSQTVFNFQNDLIKTATIFNISNLMLWDYLTF